MWCLNCCDRFARRSLVMLLGGVGFVVSSYLLRQADKKPENFNTVNMLSYMLSFLVMLYGTWLIIGEILRNCDDCTQLKKARTLLLARTSPNNPYGALYSTSDDVAPTLHNDCDTTCRVDL